MKTKKILYNSIGFTLIEIMIAMIISIICLGAAFMFLTRQQTQLAMQEEVGVAQQTLRVINNILESELRMVAFDPPDPVTGNGLGAGITAVNNTASISYTRNGQGSTPGGILNNYTFSINAANQLIRTLNGNVQIISDDVEAICFAYAIDADGNGIIDRYLDNLAAPFQTEHIIWAIDTNNDNILDANIDSNNDGTIDVRDLGAAGVLPNGIIAGAPITAFANGGNTVYATVPLTAIQGIRIWTLVRTSKGEDQYPNTTTYTVGNQVITPVTDVFPLGHPLAGALNTFNDNLHMRVASKIVTCENLTKL